VEDKYFDLVKKRSQQQQEGGSAGSKDLLGLANQELRRKERVLRDLKKRLEQYEGPNRENKPKLGNIHKQ
jgi:hypothetical protein